MGVVVAAVAAIAAALTQTGSSVVRPVTVYTKPHTRFVAFAQDGPYLAWFQPGTHGGCNAVHVSSLANGLQVELPSITAPNVTCHFARSPQQPVSLALAGTRALWTLPQTAPLPLQYLLGASVGRDQSERRFQEVAHTKRGVGEWLGGISGQGSTLAYAVTTVDYADETDCLAGDASGCKLVTSGGGVYRVTGRQTVKVPGTGPAVEVAVSGSAIAYVAANGIAKSGRPLAGADLPVTVVSAVTGKQRASIVPQGVPRALALAGPVVATLERGPLGERLAWYSSTTGRPLGSVPVPRTTAPVLAANSSSIAFRVGRSLRVVDVASHHVRTLVKTDGIPIGLSFDGRWLRWAENLPTTARISGFYVSGSG
jgi:hypothetical protein